MNKFVIAAVAAALLGSTSVSFAASTSDSGREIYQSERDFILEQAGNGHAQVNDVRNARAQALDRRQSAAPSFSATEGNGFDRNTSSNLH